MYSLEVSSKQPAGAGVTSFPLRISAGNLAVTNTGNNTATLIGLATENGNSLRTKCAIGHCRTNPEDVGDIVFLCRDIQDSSSCSMADERMRIASNGNIGIGTNTPAYSLHLHKNASSQDTRIQFTDGTTTSGASRGFHIGKNVDGEGFLFNFENKDIFFGTNITERMRIASNGNIGIGVTNPSFRLEVAAYTSSAFNIQGGYMNQVGTGTYPGPWNNVCAKFNGGGWFTDYVLASSDIRIKEDIQDINDDNALQSILSIEPKTYKYIDNVSKGDKKVYGFIAQQIREVIPEAVSIQVSYIPNIYLVADYNSNVITLLSQPTKVIIKVNDKIKCYDKDNKEIIIEVIEVIDSLTFRIKELEEYTDTKIFIYGTEVHDFHTLNKDYIFTLNVCATQELHRRIEAQNIIIKSHEDRIKDLEEKVKRLLTNT
jgi:hypothetical protein